MSHQVTIVEETPRTIRYQIDGGPKGTLSIATRIFEQYLRIGYFVLQQPRAERTKPTRSRKTKTVAAKEQ